MKFLVSAIEVGVVHANQTASGLKALDLAKMMIETGLPIAVVKPRALAARLCTIVCI